MSEFWSVAVWWPKDQGYGIRSNYANEADAHRKVEVLKALGYGVGDNEIHVKKISNDMVLKVSDER